MLVSIVACGKSAEGWQNTPCDYSIAVNDAFKFAHPFNELLLINSPKMFEPSRLEVIKKTQCNKVKTNSGNWSKIFPQQEIIRLQSFGKYLKKGHIYSSKSSPFVALSLAFNLGATDVILHGVDMENHKVFNPNNRHGTTEYRMFNYELRNIQELTRMMADEGTKVWLSKNVGALNQFLNVWKKD